MLRAFSGTIKVTLEFDGRVLVYEAISGCEEIAYEPCEDLGGFVAEKARLVLDLKVLP